MSLPNCQRMNIKLTFKFEKTVYEFIGNVFPFLEEIRFYNQSFTKNMQVRSLARNNTMSSLNKKPTTKIQAKQLTTKKVLQTKDMNKQDQPSLTEKFIYNEHPGASLLRGTQANTAQFKKFTTLLYRGLYYSVNNLKGPSQEYLKKKKVKLPEPQNSKKKFLILDLDETLIHSVFNNEKTDVKFTYKGDEFKFNVRPNCLEFLDAMSEIFNVYVFTAGTQDYAEPIVNWLNQKKKTILGVMHRKNCMQTHNGFFIKDLRIISNKELKDVVIIDNLIHSFGLQLENGIPILEFLDNKNDKELKGIEPMLRQIAEVDDVRTYLKEKLDVRSVLDINEADYLAVENFKLKS